MGCIAQVLQDPKSVNVPSSGATCCCSNIITNVEDIYLSMKEINATILRGIVKCDYGGQDEVGGAIVVATSTSNENFVGITNSDGEYSICVPIPEQGTETYTVQAYCCCSCNDDVCEDADCACGCNGD